MAMQPGRWWRRGLPDRDGETRFEGTSWWGNDRGDGDEQTAELQRREIRRLWRAACESSCVAQWTPMPNGFTVATPLMRKITLGNPTSAMVELRPGQLVEDLERAAAKIAQCLGVAALKIRETLYPMWVQVDFLEPAEPGHGVVIAFPRPPQTDLEPAESASVESPHRPRRHQVTARTTMDGALAGRD